MEENNCVVIKCLCNKWRSCLWIDDSFIFDIGGKMIFVCGVHGVGKDFYCEKLSADKGIPFYSAGNLISCVKKDKKVDCNGVQREHYKN